MTGEPTDYTSTTSKEMNKTQDGISALRLLVAQRKIYTKSKKWLSLRIAGMGIIAIAAPVVALIWPDLSVIVAAIAGLWVFLGRTAFLVAEQNLAAKAAAIQELFDINVFNMPSFGERTPSTTLEEIAKIAGDDNAVMAEAKKEKLLGWYPISESDAGEVTVAISQRANAAYSSSLLETASKIWITFITIWVIVLVILSAFLHLELVKFLLGIAFPLLPAFLDTVEYWRGMRTAKTERQVLSNEIEQKITDNSYTTDDLLIWQARIYSLRRDAPQVPDFIYKIVRNANEKAMFNVARQLSTKARGKK